MTLSASSSTQLAYWCQRVHRAKPPPRHSGAGFQIVIHLCLRNLLPWPFKLIPRDSDKERLTRHAPALGFCWGLGSRAHSRGRGTPRATTPRPEPPASTCPPARDWSSGPKKKTVETRGEPRPSWRSEVHMRRTWSHLPRCFWRHQSPQMLVFFHTGVSPGRFYSSRGAVGWIARMNTKKMNNVVLTVAEG